MAGPGSHEYDIMVVGAGVLGVTVAYWLTQLYDCRIVLVDSAEVAGVHTTSRNTGVIHRPFYLDPVKKRVFAQTCRVSYPMWERLAKDARLPWKPVGTFNVAVEEQEIKTLQRYQRWGVENGMEEGELELLDGRGVESLEPEVSCKGGLLSKTDVSVDFGVFTRHLWRLLVSHGMKFLGGHRVVSVERRDGWTEVKAHGPSGVTSMRCRYLVNAAGGGAIQIAHSCGLASGYTALHFRGEYWVVEEPFASKVTSNIYRPPRFPQFPFLDPHFVVRADGSRQIGPNAVMVPGPYVYWGMGVEKSAAFLDRPVAPKARLMMNGDFLSLLAGEWRSSLSKRVMCGRVRNFVPRLDPSMLKQRAVFGVRSSVLDASGFIPEALVLKSEGSAHIINYNSPGASGAPAFSAMVVAGLREEGRLGGFKDNDSAPLVQGWDFETASGLR